MICDKSLKWRLSIKVFVVPLVNLIKTKINNTVGTYLPHIHVIKSHSD